MRFAGAAEGGGEEVVGFAGVGSGLGGEDVGFAEGGIGAEGVGFGFAGESFEDLGVIEAGVGGLEGRAGGRVV